MVLSRRRAVLAAVSFSKVTVADFNASGELEVGVTEMERIFPLKAGQYIGSLRMEVHLAYQKLKKSRTCFSVVL